MARTETHPHPEIGDALRWLRNRAGLQQRDVGTALARRGSGLSAVWLSRIENGHERPSWQLLHRLLDVYGVERIEDLDRLLVQRPWRSESLAVDEGVEWAAVMGAPEVAPPPLRRSAKRVATGSRALADQLADLNELFLRLDEEDRAALLSEARRLAGGTDA